MLKAGCAPNKEVGGGFLEMDTPVRAQTIDFTAIEEIKAMKEKIDLSLSEKGRTRWT